LSGLTDKAGGVQPQPSKVIEKARQAWQESMLRRMDNLRDELRERSPQIVADHCGGNLTGNDIHLRYWWRKVVVPWPDLEGRWLDTDESCSTFDTAMLLYYFHTADGAPLADRWIGFRELPGGGFYHQAFQGYSGDQLAETVGEKPDSFALAAGALEGWPLPALASHAFAFLPLPRIRLAAVLWPGDEEFPSRASVLFDAGASHYMTTDGLALLGAGLTRRLIKKVES
jgi:hypothetical protein